MSEQFIAEEVERIRSGLSALFRFQGYGDPQSGVWFLGIEERGDDWSLLARLEFDEVEDCADAHVEKLGISHHHDESRGIVLQPTWNTMCDVMVRLSGRTPTQELKKEYQAREL